MGEVKALKVKLIRKEIIEEKAMGGKASLRDIKMIFLEGKIGGMMLSSIFDHAKVKYNVMESKAKSSNRGVRPEGLIFID